MIEVSFELDYDIDLVAHLPILWRSKKTEEFDVRQAGARRRTTGY